MKRVVFVLALLLVSCAHVSSRPMTPATMNLGFEDGDALPTGWNTGALGGFDVSADTAVMRGGRRSVRITSTTKGRYGSLLRTVDAGPLVGKRVRLHGWVRTKGVTGWAVVFLRVDGGESAYVMSDGPLGTTSEWKEIVADAAIAPGRELTLGVALGGEGTAWFDDLSLEVIEPKAAVNVHLAGRVLDSTGAGVAGAEVALISPSGLVSQHVRSAADGAFDFATVAGKWGVSANAPGRIELVGTFIEPREYLQSTQLTLTLAAKDGVTVKGEVAGAIPEGACLRVAAYSKLEGDVWAVPLGKDGKFATTLPRSEQFGIAAISGLSGRGKALREGDVATAALDLIVERAPPPSVVSWISSNATSLSTVDPNVALENPAALRKLVGTARVVGLGEATHGTREFLQLKHRIFRALIGEGFTFFALEIGQTDARAINAYVLHGTGTARTALGAAEMWVWENEEVLELIEWMRAWNADASHQTKVQFVGFDMQNPRSSLRAVREYLVRVAPDEAPKWLAPLEVLGHDAGMAGFVALSKEQQAETVAAVGTLLERFDASRRAWETASSANDFLVARQDARTLQQAATQYAVGAINADGSAKRDEAMAENIKWLHDNLPSGARMVVSAHNLHIADVKARMGKTLRASLGAAWLSVGLELGDGDFQALRMRDDGARANIEAIRFAPPPEALANAALLRGGPGVFALDLRALPSSGEVAAYFRSPQLVREAGYGVHPDAPLVTPQVLAERFDALLFVAHTTRSRQLAVDFTRLP